MASSALAATIFAQRMALREKTLMQEREDQQIADDRKAKLIAELNRSTDLALQAQRQASDRNSQEARLQAQAAAQLGQEAPQFEGDQEQVAANTGTLVGQAREKSAADARQQVLALRAMQDMAAQRGREYTQTQNNARFAVTSGQGERRTAALEAQVPLRQNADQRDTELAPVRRALMIAQTGEANRSPPTFGPTQNYKQDALRSFEDIEKQYPTAFSGKADFGNEALRTINQTIRDRVRFFKEEASRAYDFAANQEHDAGMGMQAGKFAVQKIYDEMIKDPDLVGAMQQMPKATLYAPVPRIGTSGVLDASGSDLDIPAGR